MSVKIAKFKTSVDVSISSRPALMHISEGTRGVLVGTLEREKMYRLIVHGHRVKVPVHAVELIELVGSNG